MQVLINIDVQDLDTAIRFYQSALPLRHTRTLFDGSVAEMQDATCRIYLLAQAEGSQATPAAHMVRSYARHWTPVHLDFAVDDIAPALQRALQAGAVQDSAVRDFSWGRLVSLSDPFGNGFCLLQFHGGIYEHVPSIDIA